MTGTLDHKNLMALHSEKITWKFMHPDQKYMNEKRNPWSPGTIRQCRQPSNRIEPRHPVSKPFVASIHPCQTIA